MKLPPPHSLESFSPRRACSSSLRRLAFLLAFAVLLAAPSLRAQIRPSALSEAEIEQVRDCRLIPDDCVMLYVKFLDLRTQQVHDLFAKTRSPGREQDTHDLIEQFTSIADELADNLDDYGPRHADIRKALPKLVSAADRWATILKSPPDNEAYDITRKIALESIRDLRESANQLIAEQTTWFKAHPPAKTEQKQKETIDLP